MDESAGTWIFWIVVILAIFFWDDIWYSSWRYGIAYNVSSERVSIDKKPHDCDFLKAPIGSKECHFNRTVRTIEWAKSQVGAPIVSYDDGKNWVNFDPNPGTSVPQTPTVVSVFVEWEKVED